MPLVPALEYQLLYIACARSDYEHMEKYKKAERGDSKSKHKQTANKKRKASTKSSEEWDRRCPTQQPKTKQSKPKKQKTQT
jgi:hypothetical protein